jgi:diguanylate cyclase (GGDEF)-like protein
MKRGNDRAGTKIDRFGGEYRNSCQAELLTAVTRLKTTEKLEVERNGRSAYEGSHVNTYVRLMTSTALNQDRAVSGKVPETYRRDLRKLDHRQWWLWSSTLLVLILLTVAVASFAFPALLSGRDDPSYSFYLNQAVRALVGIVLLFSVYLVYQQTMIMRMRNQISEQIQSLAKVENLTAEVYKLAALDQLTGLYNRRSGEQRLAEEINRSLRHERPLTVLMMDLDGLKQINDQFGHAAGDLMLRSFAERLQRAVRGSDLAVRLGGDEFMVLLPECKAEEVRHVLGRVDGLEVNYNGEKIRCRFSRGWTVYKPGETAEELLLRADATLYADKRARKPQVRPMQTTAVQRTVV